MPIVVVNRLGDLEVALPGASREGARAAGQVYLEAMREVLLAGFTSGAFVTGALSASVEMTDPYSDAASPYSDEEADTAVSVGTDVMYAAYWEWGHMNQFTRHYERVERWAPTLQTESARMLDAYESAVIAAAERVAI